MAKTRLFLSLAALMSVLLILNIVATYSLFTSRWPGHNDFMSRWEGARSYWQEGLNPYGAQASLQIQEAIYGRAALPSEDPGYFAYPFYTVLPLWPLVQVSYSWASAIWMVLLEAGLILALMLMLQHIQWRPSPLILGMLILATLLAYYPARGLLLGQPGLAVYVLEILCIWALGRERDGLAGVALAFSTIKPQMGYLIVPFLLLYGLITRRWRFVGFFTLTFGVLMGLSFVLMPSWFSDWLGQLSLYTGYTELGSPVWIVSHYPWLGIIPETGKWGILGGFGSIIEAILTIALYGLALWSWYTVLIQKKYERFLWVVALTLTITHLVAPRTATPHYVVFTLPLLIWLKDLSRKRTLLPLFIILLVIVLPWMHFLSTVTNKFEHPAVYVPVPFLTLLLLWVMRKKWWAMDSGIV
jgi:hypothetical protein